MRSTFSMLILGLVSLGTPACGAEGVPSDAPPSPSPVTITAENTDPTQGSVDGTVVETMDAGHYTYVQVETSGGRIWAAGPKTPVQVGDPVRLERGTLMVDFFSNTLDRKFDKLYLVPAIGVAGQMTAPHPSLGTGAPSATDPHQPAVATEVVVVERAEGGHTVAEIFERRSDLVGKEVAVRGKVVKYNSGIMGRNWIHVQDGTVGPDGANDLVVTSSAPAVVGSIVLVRGTVATDRDFGYGYQYSVMIEEAEVTPE